MKSRLFIRVIIAGLLLGSLCCYLEWGKDQSGFIGMMEYDLFSSNKLSSSISHPLIFLPLAGQLLLLFTVFQLKPNNRLVWVSIALLGILVIMILLSGILSGNARIILSTVPFLTASVLFIFATRKPVGP